MDNYADRGDPAELESIVLCHYKHHAEYGKPVVCDKCGGPAACGPFSHACPKCNPFDFKPCGICGTLRVYCSC